MTELASAYVTIIPSMKGAEKAIASSLGGIDTTGAGKSWGGKIVSGLGSGLTGVAKVAIGSMGAITTAVGGLAVGGGISRALKLDQANFKFKALGMDVQSTMASCNEAVKGTAFGLDAAATVATLFGASGVQAGDQMTQSLKSVAGVAAMSGDSMENIGNIFSKVAAKGKLSGDELLQLNERGINGLDALSKHLGMSQEDVRQMVTDGEIDFQTFSDAMYATFGTAAFGANDTFQGAMSNVMAALSRVGAKFASPALDGLRRVFVALIPAIDAVSKILDPLVEKFTKFVDVVATHSVAGIEAFTSKLTETGNVLTAFKAGISAAFEGTKISSFIDILSQKMNGFITLWKMGSTPIESFRLVLVNLKNTFSDIANSDGVQFFMENSPIMAPINKLIRAFNALQYALGNGLSPIDAASHALSILGIDMTKLPAPIQGVIGGFVSFGQKVSEIFGNISLNGAGFIAAFIAIFAKFHTPITAAATALVGLGSKAGGVFKIFAGAPTMLSGFTQAFAGISPMFTKLHAAFSMAGGGFAGIKAALGALISPVGLVVAAIAVLVAAFAYLFTTNEQFRNTVMSLVSSIGQSLAPIIQIIGQALSDLASTALPLITNAVDALLPVIGQIITVILQIVAALAPVFTQIVATVVPVLTQIITLVVQVATEIISALMPVISMILDAISQLIPVIMQLVPPIMQIIQVVMQIVQAIIAALMPVIQTIVDCIIQMMPIIQQIISVVVQVVTAIVNAVVPVITQIAALIQENMPTIQAIFQTVCTAIQSVVEAVFPLIQSIITTVMNVIQDVINIVMAAINGDWSGVWNGIKQLASDIWNGIKSIISSAINAVKGVISAILNAISSLWNSVWSGISSFVSDTWNNVCNAVSNGVSNMIGFIQDIPSKIKGFFSDAASWLLDAGKNIISGLIDGIKGAIGGLGDALGGIGDFIVSHKGPPSYDKVMLTPAGKMIMGGLINGINDMVPTLGKTLGGVTDMVNATSGELKPFDSDINASANTFSKSQVELRSDSTVNDILDAITSYLPQLANQQVVLDTGVVAGAMTKKMDRNLGELQRRRAGALC